MKITHWSLKNGSGLAQVADDICMVERRRGIDSQVCDCFNQDDFKRGMDADLHVAHAHMPNEIAVHHTKPWIVMMHGGPEYIIESMMDEDGVKQKGNAFAVSYQLMQEADAVVSFWDRHIKIWTRMTEKPVYKIAMGVPLGYWSDTKIKPIPLGGNPIFMTSENSVRSKWILDLLLLFPWLLDEFPGAKLHCYYIPMNLHKMFYPLLYANKGLRGIFLSDQKLGKDTLLATLRGAKYYLSPVRYGDFNQMSLQAKAAGCKVISYKGNPYADYWLDEGDQRTMALQLLAIMKGWTQPRFDIEPVPDTNQMVDGILRVYKEVLGKSVTSE